MPKSLLVHCPAALHRQVRRSHHSGQWLGAPTRAVTLLALGLLVVVATHPDWAFSPPGPTYPHVPSVQKTANATPNQEPHKEAPGGTAGVWKVEVKLVSPTIDMIADDAGITILNSRVQGRDPYDSLSCHCCRSPQIGGRRSNKIGDPKTHASTSMKCAEGIAFTCKALVSAGTTQGADSSPPGTCNSLVLEQRHKPRREKCSSLSTRRTVVLSRPNKRILQVPSPLPRIHQPGVMPKWRSLQIASLQKPERSRRTIHSGALPSLLQVCRA